ncbi:MAG: helix-turn-helix transcriptional regulator [Candidatus Aminicenantes bacterium]|nr:MAG: helix-turn-helix transcriptional regulator [Candidatus Aminicenantes bacterium]
MSSERCSKLLEGFEQDFQISKRESEIMGLILQGKSNKEIEDLLFISYNTVKNHIYNIYQKLGVNSRGQMIHAVLQAQRQRENSMEES